MNQDVQISKVETSLTALLGPPLNCSTASCVFLSAPHTPAILDSLNQHHAGEEQRLSQGLTPSTACAELPLTYFVVCPEVRILEVTTTADKRVKTLGVTHSNDTILPGYHIWGSPDSPTTPDVGGIKDWVCWISLEVYGSDLLLPTEIKSVWPTIISYGHLK